MEIPHCHNCGAELGGRYCAECGQQHVPLPLSLGTLSGELLGVQFVGGAESKLLRTTLAFFARPGLLTAEFLAGRRVRYIAPLQIYAAAGTAFFASVALNQDGPPLLLRMLRTPPKPGTPIPPEARLLDHELGRHVQRFQALTREERHDLMNDTYQRFSGSAMFLLVPAIAALLWLRYRRAKRTFSEHVIFALHIQAFAYVASLAAVWAPFAWFAAVRWLVLVAIAVYAFLAFRRVYDHRRPRWSTIATFAGLGAIYAAMLVVTIFTLAAIAMMRA